MRTINREDQMNNDDRFNSSDELDEEIAKSVEKLVDVRQVLPEPS